MNLDKVIKISVSGRNIDRYLKNMIKRKIDFIKVIPVDRNMVNIKSKNTSIEIKLAKALWHKGYRYRKNFDGLPGKPDIVITKYKIAIFCDGEFFHGKDWEVLKPRLEKSNNSEFWISKISRNRERDDEINKRLLFEGWTVIRFWGDDIKKHT